jgi:hypothetical protein
MNELLLKGLSKPFFYLDVCNGFNEQFKKKALIIYTDITKSKVCAAISCNHKRLGVTLIENSISFTGDEFHMGFSADSSDSTIAGVLESVDDFLGIETCKQ